MARELFPASMGEIERATPMTRGAGEIVEQSHCGQARRSFMCLSSQLAVTELRASVPAGAGTLPCTHRRMFLYHGFQVVQGLGKGQGVHLATVFFAILDGRLQKMPGDLYCQRIGDDLAGATVVLAPGSMWQSDPNRAALDEKFDVHRIGMAGGDGGHDGLEHAMHVLAAPVVLGPKIVVHNVESVVHSGGERQMKAGIGGRGRESCAPLLVRERQSAKNLTLVSELSSHGPVRDDVGLFPERDHCRHNLRGWILCLR